MKKGWEKRRLGEVLQIQNGYAFDSKRFNPSKGPPLVRIRSLKSGTETETRYSGDYDEKYLVQKGDLLIGMDGEFGCYEWKGESSLLNQRVCRLQGFAKELLPRFLFYGVNDHLKAIEDVTGYATVKHLSSKQILDIEFLVPPLTEQQRIVGVLDEAFEGLATAKANAEKNLQNARALFESHLQSVFTQRGKGWVEKEVEEVGTTQTGSTPKTSDQANYGSFIPFIKPGDFNPDGTLDYENEGLSKKGLDVSRKVKANSILMVCIGATIGKCGYCDRDVTTNQQINALSPHPGISHLFMYYQMLTQGFQHRVRLNAGQATLPIISKGKWSALTVFVPPSLQEQQTIATHLDNLAAETQRLAAIYEQKLTALEALKKSLLHQAFSGEL
jgi:type I restriction enzyme S subunit